MHSSGPEEDVQLEIFLAHGRSVKVDIMYVCFCCMTLQHLAKQRGQERTKRNEPYNALSAARCALERIVLRFPSFL